jgi:5'-AMP-activated protein kinase, regulatory gamma subunit
MTTLQALFADSQQSLITIPVSSNIGDAMQLLHDHNIISAPVVDETNKCVGLVDFIDMAVELMKIWDRSHKPTAAEMGEISWKSMEWASESVGAIINASGRNPLHTLPLTATVEEARKILSTGIHRLLVTDADGSAFALLTQSRLLSHCLTVLSESELGKSVYDVEGLITDRVIKVGTNEVLHSVLELMVNYKLSSVPVCNTSGKIVAVFSASDLITMTPHHFLSSVTLPIFSHVESQKDKQMHQVYIFSNPTSHDVQYVMKTMLNNNIHRMFVLDKREDLTGVIAMTDLLRMEMVKSK